MEVPRRYQTFWPRFWAGLIDGLVFLPVAVVDATVRQSTSAPALLAAWFILNTLSYDFYSVALHARYGQTLGKRVMGIKVLSASEGTLSLRQALLRDCVPILMSAVTIVAWTPAVFRGMDPTVAMLQDVRLFVLTGFGSLAWFVAELVTMLFNAKRRALHDFIAGSVVVRLAQ